MANEHSCRINSGPLLLLLAHAGRHAEGTLYLTRHVKFSLLRFSISPLFYSLTYSPPDFLTQSRSIVRKRHETEAPVRTLPIGFKQKGIP